MNTSFRSAIAASAASFTVASLLIGASLAQTPASGDVLAPYYGNTFISLHDDGTQFIVLFNADKTFSLTRRGGADTAAAYTMTGSYTLEGTRVCFHANKPPAGSPECVPVETGKSPGQAWDTNGRMHEVHMILVGRR
jgi:hypothetical protein